MQKVHDRDARAIWLVTALVVGIWAHLGLVNRRPLFGVTEAYPTAMVVTVVVLMCAVAVSEHFGRKSQRGSVWRLAVHWVIVVFAIFNLTGSLSVTVPFREAMLTTERISTRQAPRGEVVELTPYESGVFTMRRAMAEGVAEAGLMVFLLVWVIAFPAIYGAAGSVLTRAEEGQTPLASRGDKQEASRPMG